MMTTELHHTVVSIRMLEHIAWAYSNLRDAEGNFVEKEYDQVWWRRTVNGKVRTYFGIHINDDVLGMVIHLKLTNNCVVWCGTDSLLTPYLLEGEQLEPPKDIMDRIDTMRANRKLPK